MITISHVKKRFDAVVALDDVSLSIAPGERVAFVGANGSGKTTLLRALLGLVRVEGKITISGVDVAKDPEVALRGVAYIPQIAPPIEASVAEVVRAHSALRGKKEEATYERAGRLGLDLGASRAKRFRDLSGGMKQKLLAAMALAAESEVLVCDEPTANLDGEARVAFFAELSARPPSSVVVLCSHRVEEVQKLVGRVVELGEGRVVRDAPLADLLLELKAFRVEVTLRDDAKDSKAAAALLERGFAPCGTARFGANVAQHEKVELVTRLLAEHSGELADLSIVPADDLTRVSREAGSKRAEVEA